jgi:GAF domain-containing protein
LRRASNAFWLSVSDIDPAAALLSRKPVAVSRIGPDALEGCWSSRAYEAGFRSVVSFPFEGGRALSGVLTIYSRDPDAFSGDDQSLLGQLAQNIAYGLTHLRDEARRCAAEEELKKSESSTSSYYRKHLPFLFPDIA